MSARLPAMPTDRELATAIDHLSRWEIDSRQIVVRVSDDPSATPVEVWTATLQKPVSGGSLPLDVMAELKVALESTEGYPPPYLLDTRRGYTEWGASGVSEVIELVVGWGLAGIVGNATYDALLATVMRLARTFRHDSSGQPHPVDQQEAEEGVGTQFTAHSTSLSRMLTGWCQPAQNGGVKDGSCAMSSTSAGTRSSCRRTTVS
jgi:hypothetical protein